MRLPLYENLELKFIVPMVVSIWLLDQGSHTKGSSPGALNNGSLDPESPDPSFL